MKASDLAVIVLGQTLGHRVVRSRFKAKCEIVDRHMDDRRCGPKLHNPG